jgi:uncharacterized membrane protein SpoIIM required for sporulation
MKVRHNVIVIPAVLLAMAGTMNVHLPLSVVAQGQRPGTRYMAGGAYFAAESVALPCCGARFMLSGPVVAQIPPHPENLIMSCL